MKKLRIAVYPSDGGGCGSYRLIWPAQAVKQQFADEAEVLIGADAPAVKIRWNQVWKREYDRVPPWVGVADAWMAEPVDVAIFQRPTGHEMPGIFKALRARGVTVIIDMDDNFDLIDPRNAAWFGAAPYWHTRDRVDQYLKKYGKVKIEAASHNDEYFYVPAHEGRYSRRFIHESLKHATMLTASTPHIAQHYKNAPKTVEVIENRIPESYLTIDQPRAQTTVGWTGSLATHPYDFKSVGPALVQARKKSDFKFKIIGDGIGILEKTGLQPDEVTGWTELIDYPYEFATLDVIVCPLEDQQFNYSKSWLKPLEAAALGVVPICSPVPEYVALNKAGIGVMATRPRDWEKHIVRLVNDDIMRKDLAVSGKEIAAQMTIEKNARLWLESWQRAYEVNNA